MKNLLWTPMGCAFRILRFGSDTFEKFFHC